MVINGKEFNFSITKKSDAQKYEEALKALEKKEKEISKMNGSSLIEIYNKMEEMFSEFFMIATGVNVIEGCEDITDMQDAYFEFLEIVKEQSEKMKQQFGLERIK